jgi:hypothetical protein
MIEPGSVGDWVQASLVGGLLAATAILFHRALRHDDEAPRSRRVRTPDLRVVDLVPEVVDLEDDGATPAVLIVDEVTEVGTERP